MPIQAETRTRKAVKHNAKSSLLDILSRSLAAGAGGYVASYAFTGALALALPLQPLELAYLATALSFVLYPVLVIWAFAAATPVRAWAGPLLVTALSSPPWLWHGTLA